MNNSNPHHSSIKTYLLVFFGLAILTGCTVGLSYLGLPHHTAIALAALIALVKCTLIATFFMHLRFESKGIYALILTGLFFVGVLIVSIIPDIGLVK
jgi:cytochrome c oxidase subunit 4